MSRPSFGARFGALGHRPLATVDGGPIEQALEGRRADRLFVEGYPRSSSPKARKPTSADIALTAYHEAGRLVAAIVLGRPFTRAVIREDGSAQVEPAFQLPEQHGDDLSPVERTLIEDEVVQLFAGGYAEERFTGRTLTDAETLALVTMPMSDWFNVAVSGRTLDPGSDMDALAERARVLVGEYWGTIEAAAALLLSRGRVTRADAMWVLDEHPAKTDTTARTDHLEM